MPTNSIATPKVYIARCRREEGIAKSEPDEQKPDTKAYMADKLTKDSEVLKATVTHVCKSGG